MRTGRVAGGLSQCREILVRWSQVMTHEEKTEEIMSEILELRKEIKELKDFIVKQTMNANYRTRHEF